MILSFREDLDTVLQPFLVSAETDVYKRQALSCNSSGIGSGTGHSRDRRFDRSHRVHMRSPRAGQSETHLTRMSSTVCACEPDREDRVRMHQNCRHQTHCQCGTCLLVSRLRASSFRSPPLLNEDFHPVFSNDDTYPGHLDSKAPANQG